MMMIKPVKYIWVIFLLLLTSGGLSGQADKPESIAALQSQAPGQISASGDEYYDPRFEVQGFNGRIQTLSKIDKNIYAGGKFTRAGGVSTNNIARWDGVRWKAMGNGVTSFQQANVSSIVAYNENVIAGGYFNTAGSAACKNIAQWDGMQWMPLGSGINGTVSALTVWQGSLYAAGSFTLAGSTVVNNIARWDGSGWHDVGGGVSGQVYALTVWQNKLVAGGQFSAAGSITVRNIVFWNGVEWTAPASGVNNSVYALGSDGNKLYAGGKFTEAGGQFANRIGVWNGSLWNGLGGGLNDYPMALGVQGNFIYAGGAFSRTGDGAANHFARWHTLENRWQSLGSGVSGGAFPFIETIFVSGPDVYVGGGFTYAGSKESYYIALWSEVYPYEGFSKKTLWDLQAYENAVDIDKSESAGCAWGDMDNDGDFDLYVANENGQDNQLYLNNGSGKFIQIFQRNLVQGGGHSVGAAWGDYNNDYFLDLYVVNQGERNRLFRNNGDGTFTEIMSGAIVEDNESSTAAAWADYDNDGYLDLLVTNLTDRNSLYHNAGDGTFTKVTAGEIVSDSRASTGLGWCDYDQDGDQDVFVTHTGYVENSLYENKGNGNFSEVLTEPFLSDKAECIGCSWGDFDRNGFPDLLVTSSGQYDFLYRNMGKGIFEKETSMRPVLSEARSRGSGWCDFDKDGDLDLVILRKGSQKNRLYLNYGAQYFYEYLLPDFDGWGGAWCDHDDNGDQAFFVTVSGKQNLLYVYTGNPYHWLHVQCRGTLSNGWGIGARVRLKAGIWDQAIWQVQEISSQTGSGGQNSLTAHFGLAEAAIVDSLIIEWPSGIVWDTTNVAVNQSLIVQEHASKPVTLPPKAQVDTVIITDDSPMTCYPLGNDSDPGGRPFSISGFDTTETLGSVQYMFGDLFFTYIPVSGNDIHEDHLLYYISNDQMLSDTAQVIFKYKPSTTVHPAPGNIPVYYRLYENVPNPFNPDTEIRFDLPRAGAVRIDIFNIRGEHVLNLVERDCAAGSHRAIWRGQDQSGAMLPGGLYFYRLQADHFTAVKKMLFIR